jgi:hypothetical protein
MVWAMELGPAGKAACAKGAPRGRGEALVARLAEAAVGKSRL